MDNWSQMPSMEITERGDEMTPACGTSLIFIDVQVLTRAYFWNITGSDFTSAVCVFEKSERPPCTCL